MNHARTVFKNSLWLIFQPLILNVISLFVIGYIARKLGQANYGEFIFAFGFVSIFSPFSNMGLSTLNTREITENREDSAIILGKFILLRFFLSILTFLALILFVNLLNYSSYTKTVVYIAGLTLIFNGISGTFYSAFQGLEKMQFIAISQFVSGFTLTILSVVVLYLGYHLIGLTLVYAFGSFLGLIVAVICCLTKVTIPIIRFDFIFWRSRLRNGLIFFLPSIAATIRSRIGLIFLSKMWGDISVGIYGASNSLVEKLVIIPDSVCTAIFPALATLYKNSRKEAELLFQKFFLLLFLVSFPIAVGTTILADSIIKLIYGIKFQDSALILQIQIWWLFLFFLAEIPGWTLGATHKEKTAMKVTLFTSICSVILNLLLIPRLKQFGLVISDVLVTAINFVFLVIIIRKYFVKNFIPLNKFLKAVIANIIMGLFIYLFKGSNLFLVVLLAISVYSFTILRLGILSIPDFISLSKVFARK